MHAISIHREREKKLAELKSIKTEYQPGVWNVNAILLGGLGNEPDVDGKLLCHYYLQKEFKPFPALDTI